MTLRLCCWKICTGFSTSSTNLERSLGVHEATGMHGAMGQGSTKAPSLVAQDAGLQASSFEHTSSK